MTDEDTKTRAPNARECACASFPAPGGGTSLDQLESIGGREHDDNCALCHALKPPQFAKANHWIGHVNAMKRYTPLNGEEFPRCGPI